MIGEVVQLTKKECEPFILKKHYSKRMPIFWAGFGLVTDGFLEGVVVYGQPSPAVQKHAFKDRTFRLYELSRLVVQSEQKNAASFLVGNSLRLLHKMSPPCAVVSYADTNYGHCGIIYQATNWLYTGATISHDVGYVVDGEVLHAMSFRDRFNTTSPVAYARKNNIEMIKPKPKHRYFYICGDRYQKRNMLAQLRYPVISKYPKLEKTQYDDGPRLEVPYVKSLFNKK